jgi:flavin-dependent dehydrogenase
MKMHDAKKTINVIGAGPAGLVAAINLAKAGIAVTLHESAPIVGHRFHGDFQGIENWTTESDARDFLTRINVDVNFRFEPYSGGIFVSPNLCRREIRTRKPLFYLVERGSGKECLDYGLMRQAQSVGVKMSFNSRIWNVDRGGLVAVGPRAADMIAKGMVFETSLGDEAYAIVDDRLAPKGYAYLLINQGRATLATVIARDFRNEKIYFQRTLEAIRKLVPIEMRNSREFGGYGNFFLRPTQIKGNRVYLGESAGFQDALFGFGMRYAMASGFLAAQSIIRSANYDDLWKQDILPRLRTSVSNRVIYELLGNRGYGYIAKRIARRRDLRDVLREAYNPSLVKLALYPAAVALANFCKRMRVEDKSCHHVDCSCVWCTHMKEQMSLEACHGSQNPGAAFG